MSPCSELGKRLCIALETGAAVLVHKKIKTKQKRNCPGIRRHGRRKALGSMETCRTSTFNWSQQVAVSVN